jgi:phosphoglycolate phosphatase-like HAD superfamily hydrolase
MLKNIIWDFDGVILDSMPIRTKGFELLFKDYPEEQVKELVKYHEEQGGLSRYHKIRYFYEKILGKSITEKKVFDLAGDFSTIMLKELCNPELIILDAADWIKENAGNYRFFIASGSDQTELREINKQLNLAQYFEGIYGSPAPKNENVEMIIREFSLDKTQTALIGDSINDREAAQVNGIQFYGYNNQSLKSDDHGFIETFKNFNPNKSRA